MLGSMIVKVAFAGALFSTIAYFLSFTRREEKWAVRAQYGFYLGALGTFAAVALLMYFNPSIPVHLRLELQFDFPAHLFPHLNILRRAGRELHAVGSLYSRYWSRPHAVFRQERV